MAIGVRDRKRLWGLSASRCAFPDCRQELVEETSDGQAAVLVGQEAHIVGQSSDGPRGISDLSATERDSYDNLVLLWQVLLTAAAGIAQADTAADAAELVAGWTDLPPVIRRAAAELLNTLSQV
jgi:hypothetical protein